MTAKKATGKKRAAKKAAPKKATETSKDFAGQVQATRAQMEEDERKLMEELEREQAELDAKREAEAKQNPKKAHVVPKGTVKPDGTMQPPKAKAKAPAKKKASVKKKAPAKKVAARIAMAGAVEKKGAASKPPAVPPKKKTAEKRLPALPPASEVVMYDPRKLEVEEGWNPRFDMGDMQALIHSVGTRGVSQPIICKIRTKSATGDTLVNPRLVVSSGHRRQAASVKALEKGYTACAKVPVIIRRYKTEEEAYADALVLNDHKSLNPVEVCAALNHFVEQGKNVKEIAEYWCKRQTWVRARLALKDAGDRLSTALAKGEISVQDSVEILKQAGGDMEAQDRLVSKRNFAKKKQKLSRRPVDDNGLHITPARSRKLLSDIASAYMRFRRSKGPAKAFNEDWVELEDLLLKVRKAKSQGLLSV